MKTFRPEEVETGPVDGRSPVEAPHLQNDREGLSFSSTRAYRDLNSCASVENLAVL